MNAKKVLVIDDNRSDLDTIQVILDKMKVNYTLHSVSNGRDALMILMGSSRAYVEYRTGVRKERPDLILLNTQLPDMSGSEFLEIVGKYYSLADIKVFLMTNKGVDTDMSAYKNFSIAGQLNRPFQETSVSSDEFKSLKMELSGKPIYLLFPVLADPQSIFKGISGFLRNSFLKIKAAVFPATYTVGAKILTGVALTVVVGLSLPKPRETKQTEIATKAHSRESKKMSATEEIETIMELYADLIPKENKENRNVAVILPKSSTTKVAGLIPGVSNPEPEKEMFSTSSRQTPNLRIKVSEEKDSVSN